MNASTPTEIIATLPAIPSGGGLVAAIAAVMAEVHIVAKRGENEFHRYRYATMGDILKEVTPLLGKHGLVIFQSETGRAMFDDDNVIAVEYAFTVAHASGETWPQPLRQTGVSTCRNSKGGWDDKALNKCHTAARKYFLLALFQIPMGEEPDADQSENERPTKQVVRTITPAPKHRLKQGGNADRAMIARARRSWAAPPEGPSRPFLAKDAGKAFYNERNPPPHDTVPDGVQEAATALNRRLYPMNDELPGDLGAPKLNHTERDGIPDFLDRRKANDAAEPSYLDLVRG